MNFLKKMLGMKVTVERTYQVSRVVNADFLAFGSCGFSYYEDPENPIDFQKICDVYYKHFFTLMPSENAAEIITRKGAPEMSDEDLMIKASKEKKYFVKLEITLKDEPFYHIIYFTTIKDEYYSHVVKSIYNAHDELETIHELGHAK